MSFFPKKEPTTLDIEIDRILEFIADQDPLDPDTVKALAYLDRLYDLRAKSLPKRNGLKFSGDAVLGAFASLAGIVLILYREELHPINSKALPFVKKTNF